MITISLCMIVKNEEKVLARCLDSVAGVVDEIIIVDTGSTDATKEIAARYTSQVLDFAWIDDFSAARNLSFAQASQEYILWLDADDILKPEDREKLLQLKANFPADVDVAMLRYNVAFDVDGNCTFTYYRERLVRRVNQYLWHEPVHEYIALHGKTQQFDIAITHGDKERSGATTRNLDIYRGIEERQGKLSTRGLYYYARELRTHKRFPEAVTYYRKFLAAPDGWVEDRITAATGLAHCLLQLKDQQQALEELCKSLQYDLPRAETCCLIGSIHNQRGDRERAVFWYKLALDLPRPEGWGFVSEDDWGFVPHMQLCMLLDNMGDREQAYQHHLAAKKIKPSDPSVQHNEAYFALH